MKHFAKIDDAGWVLEVFEVEDSDEHDYPGLVQINGWTGYGVAPAKPRVVSGALSYQDPRPLSAVRAEKWTEIKSIRNELMDAPITVDGVTVDGDGASRFNVMGAVIDMQLTGEPTRGWICADNVRRVLTAVHLQQIGIAMAARTQSLVDIGDALRSQINDPSKTSAAEVDAIQWPAP